MPKMGGREKRKGIRLLLLPSSSFSLRNFTARRHKCGQKRNFRRCLETHTKLSSYNIFLKVNILLDLEMLYFLGEFPFVRIFRPEKERRGNCCCSLGQQEKKGAKNSYILCPPDQPTAASDDDGDILREIFSRRGRRKREETGCEFAFFATKKSCLSASLGPTKREG